MDGCDSITETEGDPLRLGADSDISCKLSIVVFLLLDGDINKSVFTKYTAGSHSQERKEHELLGRRMYDKMIPQVC